MDNKPYIPAELRGVFAMLHNTQVEIKVDPNRYEDHIEDYQERHEFGLAIVGKFYRHYKSGEVVRVVAHAHVDEDSHAPWASATPPKLVTIYRNPIGDLYYTPAEEFQEQICTVWLGNETKEPKRVQCKKPFEWTFTYSLFAKQIQRYRRWVSQVYSFDQVKKLLLKRTADPLYVINNMAHFHQTGNVDIIIPLYRVIPRDGTLSSALAETTAPRSTGIRIPGGWLPIDITMLATRQDLNNSVQFKQMVAAGNIGVISTWRARRILNSPSGKTEQQRRIDHEAFVRSEGSRTVREREERGRLYDDYDDNDDNGNHDHDE